MAKPGRNEPCPCGSGKKYKKCCLRRERERENERHLTGQAPEIALDWLRRHHFEAVDDAIAGQFLAFDEEEEFERLEQLPEDHFTMVMINAHEWLLAEGRIVLDGGEREAAAVDLVLGPGGPRLDAVQRTYLEKLASRPLGLYEVVECQPGRGFRLRDVLDPEARHQWVEERAGSRTLRQGQILGARLIPGDPWTLSGAIYAIPRNRYPEMLATLRDELAACRDAEREPAIVSSVIIDFWLVSLLAPPPELVDAASGEPLVWVQDHYQVADWDRLAAVLAAEDDVEGDRDEGWTRFQALDGDMRRALLHLDVLGEKDRLVVFARTLKTADEGREWLERLAGASVAHLIRDLSDPAHVWEEPRPGRGSRAGSGKLDLAPEERQSLFEQLYADWPDKSLPALGGESPREAVEKEDGRRRVVELLQTFEMDERRKAGDESRDPVDFGFLWEALRLDRELLLESKSHPSG